MITRKQYLNKECTFNEYYGQFVTPELINRVLISIGKDAILNSTNPHFNDIPLKKWDLIDHNFLGITAKMKECGDYLTAAGWVCITKEAARQIKENASKQ